MPAGRFISEPANRGTLASIIGDGLVGLCLPQLHPSTSKAGPSDNQACAVNPHPTNSNSSPSHNQPELLWGARSHDLPVIISRISSYTQANILYIRSLITTYEYTLLSSRIPPPPWQNKTPWSPSRRSSRASAERHSTQPSKTPTSFSTFSSRRGSKLPMVCHLPRSMLPPQVVCSQ